jgi:hypothetical protein
MTVLAYRLTVWVVSMNVESPRHHHRATLLQNRRSPVDARPLEAVVPVRPLSAFFLEWASAMPALMIEYQVDLRRRPNLSEMFQRREFRVLVSQPRLAWKVLRDDFVVSEMVPLREPHRANLQDSPRGHYFLSCFSVFCWRRDRGGPSYKAVITSHDGVIRTAIFLPKR